MKKSAFLFLSLSLGAFAIVIFAFKPAGKPGSIPIKVAAPSFACGSHGSTDLTQCCNFISPMSTFTLGVKSVSFTAYICYIPSITPPWTSTNQFGIIADPAKRPASTRVITATSVGGATWEVTVYSSGAIYTRLLSGTTPGQGTSFSGLYTL